MGENTVCGLGVFCVTANASFQKSMELLALQYRSFLLTMKSPEGNQSGEE